MSEAKGVGSLREVDHAHSACANRPYEFDERNVRSGTMCRGESTWRTCPRSAMLASAAKNSDSAH